MHSTHQHSPYVDCCTCLGIYIVCVPITIPKYPYLLSDFCSHEEQIVFGHIWKPYNMHTHISTTIPILVYIHTKVSISIIFCRYANMTFIWLILPLVLVSSIGECSRSKRDAKLLVNSGEQDCHNS